MNTTFVPAGTTRDGRAVYEIIPQKETTMVKTSRNVRIDDVLWHEAIYRANEMGETVSDVIRRALTNYVEESKLALPVVTHLVEGIMARWPSVTRDLATEAVLRAAKEFSINLNSMGKDDADAIRNYAAGYLGYFHDIH